MSPFYFPSHVFSSSGGSFTPMYPRLFFFFSQIIHRGNYFAWSNARLRCTAVHYRNKFVLLYCCDEWRRFEFIMRSLDSEWMITRPALFITYYQMHDAVKFVRCIVARIRWLIRNRRSARNWTEVIAKGVRENKTNGGHSGGTGHPGKSLWKKAFSSWKIRAL